MAQQPIVPVQLPNKPITLTILPINTQNSHSPPTINQQVIPSTQVHIPNFNHIPIIPATNQRVPELSLEEKARRRLENDRLRAARYRQKTSDYQKLGTLDTEKEKITSLVLLCYPELRNMNPQELETKVCQFISSLHN